jgi:hypothetical protein
MNDQATPISLANANRIANQMTGGEVAVVHDGFGPVLVRKGFVVTLPLHSIELTEACIRERLADWKNWPQ